MNAHIFKGLCVMEKLTTKLLLGLIAVLLTVIGFFLSATYNKIVDTNEKIYELQVQLAAITEKEKHFMTYSDVSALIDTKIAQYHHKISK